MTKEEKRQYDKRYREIHKEQRDKQKKQYYQTHKEDRKRYNQQYRKAHKEQINEQGRQYYYTYKEKIIQYHKQYYKTHKKKWEQYNKINSEQRYKTTKQWQKVHPGYNKKYQKSEKGKETRRRVYAKRKGLSLIPLNKPRNGWVFHHLDRVYGIYIPEEEHRKIHHSVLKNYGMDEMNAVAWNYRGE